MQAEAATFGCASYAVFLKALRKGAKGGVQRHEPGYTRHEMGCETQAGVETQTTS